MSQSRKTVAAAVAILKKYLVEKTPISQLCEEYDLEPSQIYYWPASEPPSFTHITLASAYSVCCLTARAAKYLPSLS
jgi:hypothetical protein